jgi:hypothetical protein
MPPPNEDLPEIVGASGGGQEVALHLKAIFLGVVLAFSAALHAETAPSSIWPTPPDSPASTPPESPSTPVAPPVEPPSSPEKVFENVYGKDYQKALANKDTTEATNLALVLLNAAEVAKGDTATRTYLYQKAYELGLRGPAGYATAIRAAERWRLLDPDRHDEIGEKLAAACQLQFKAVKAEDQRTEVGDLLEETLLDLALDFARDGDFVKASAYHARAQNHILTYRSDRREEFQGIFRQVMARLASAQQVEPLKARLKANPKDKEAADKLARLFLVELDNPVAAGAYADGISDVATQRMILLAGMKLTALPAAACLALGEWYKGLAESAAPAVKEPLLERAVSYLRQYLEMHTAADTEHLKATVLMDQVTVALFKFGGMRTIDLLKLVELPADAVQGKWVFKDGNLRSDTSNWALLRLPYQPPDEYDLQVVFSRVSDGDNVAAILPAGGHLFEFGIGFNGNRTLGVETVGGKGILQSGLSAPGAIRKGQKCTLLAQVRQGEFRGYVDGKLVVQWKTDYKTVGLNIAYGWADPKTPALGSSGATTEFLSVRLTEVRGRGQVYRSPQPPPRLLFSGG